MKNARPTERKLTAIRPGEKMGDVLHICWMLHNSCNNRCSYCRDFNWKGDYRWLKYDHVIGFLERVFRRYDKKSVYHVSFTGGEPSLWPEFPELCAYLKKNGVEIGLTSNGARNPDYWKSLSKDLNWVCLSYHPEYTNDDHFIQVIRELAHKTFLSVRLMMHKEKKFWDRSAAFGERLKTLSGIRFLFVEYVPLQDDFGLNSRPMKYAARQNAFFAENTHFEVKTAPELESLPWGRDVWDYYSEYNDGTREFCRPNDLVARGQVNFHGWSCNVGLDSLFINHQGYVSRGNCKEGGVLGHIFDEDLAFPAEPIRCSKTFCPCGTDILVKKEAR